MSLHARMQKQHKNGCRHEKCFSIHGCLWWFGRPTVHFSALMCSELCSCRTMVGKHRYVANKCKFDDTESHYWRSVELTPFFIFDRFSFHKTFKCFHSHSRPSPSAAGCRSPPYAWPFLYLALSFLSSGGSGRAFKDSSRCFLLRSLWGVLLRDLIKRQHRTGEWAWRLLKCFYLIWYSYRNSNFGPRLVLHNKRTRFRWSVMILKNEK